ncbi:hypothetical protein D3C75_1323330 [compost metagenome]
MVRLAREPGKRESRFMHLFSGEIEAAPVEESMAGDSELAARVAVLESEVASLKQQLQRLLAGSENE